MKNTNNAINNINAKNVTINQTINFGGIGAAGNTAIPEDISLSDLLAILGDVEKAETTPTAKALSVKTLEDGNEEEIPPLVQALDGDCRLYDSGYAIYSNCSGHTVVWLPDCRTFTHYFDKLTDKEKEYLPQSRHIGEDVLGSQPWFMAVLLRGDHQLERNAMDRKSDRKGKNQKLSLDEIAEKEDQEASWRPGCRFDNPETAYIRKETIDENLAKLTDKQREMFVLYHADGYTQEEIADMLGIRRQVVNKQLKAAKRRIKG